MPKLFNCFLTLFLLTLTFEGSFAPRSRKMGGGKPPSKSRAKSSGGDKIKYIFDVNPKNVPDPIILYNIFISCEHNYRRYCQKDDCRLNNVVNLNVEERYCPNDKFRINFEQAANGDIFHLFNFECPSISSGNDHHYHVECDLNSQEELGTCLCTLPESEEHSERAMAGASTSSGGGPPHGDREDTSGNGKGSKKSSRSRRKTGDRASDGTELAGGVEKLRIDEKLDIPGSTSRAADAKGRRDADVGRQKSGGGRRDDKEVSRKSGPGRRDDDGVRRKSGGGRRNDKEVSRKSGPGRRDDDGVRRKSRGGQRHKNDREESRYGQRNGEQKSNAREGRKSGGRKSNGREGRKSGGRKSGSRDVRRLHRR